MDNYFVHGLKKKVLQAGGEYVGIQMGDLGVPYIMYNDPVTHSTLMLEVDLATVNNLKYSMLKKRLLFAKNKQGKNGGCVGHLFELIYSIKACAALAKKIIVLSILIICSIMLILCI